MRFVLQRRTEGQIEFGMIYGLIALLALIAGRFPPVVSLAPSCVFHALTGAPCPTCGGTRSIVLLSHGNVVSAFLMNPAVAAGALVAVLSLLYSLISAVFGLPRIKAVLSGGEKDSIRLFAAVILLINWLYLVMFL